MGSLFSFSRTTTVLLLQLFFIFFSSSHAINNHTPLLLKGIDIERPVLDVFPSPLHGVKDTLRCERVEVSGISRFKLGSYASSFRITLALSAAIPERLHYKIQVCFHRNNSLGWCRCEKDEWRSVQKGMWSAVMSPYETRYVDMRINNDISDSVTVALEEDFQKWRLICLAMGSVFLLLAPIISSWVPFYYSSSMAIGIFLVIIILLFQGMKLLPTGRKNSFYITIYGLVLGVGSVLLHQFSSFANSILQSFGLSEEMHNPVAIFILLGIILAGAALGYWVVRRFVISEEDGSVDTGVAQFVKWAIRIIGATFVLQSTLDPLLAIGALVSCGAVCNLISLVKWLHGWYETSGHGDDSLQLMRRTHDRAEFLGNSTPKGKMWNSPKQSAWSESPVRVMVRSKNSKRLKVSVNPIEDLCVRQAQTSSFRREKDRARASSCEAGASVSVATQEASSPPSLAPSLPTLAPSQPLETTNVDHLEFNVGDEVVPRFEINEEEIRVDSENLDRHDVLADDEESAEIDVIDDPQDKTLLASYDTHVARDIWHGNEHNSFEWSCNRTWKLPRLIDMPGQVADIVMNSGLTPLVCLTNNTIDKRLMSSFVERWYPDTNTFHLPVGEMTITLDDVSALLHIGVTGNLIEWSKPQATEAAKLMTSLLGVSEDEARLETRATRGGAVRFHMLEKWYSERVAEDQFEEAARCYILCLVGSTLFYDKSKTFVGCQYLIPLEDVNMIQQYAWGACGLAHLYNELSLACQKETKQLGGYCTLLQAWINEYFPYIGCAIPREGYEEDKPRVMKWDHIITTGNMKIQYRSHLERLRIDQVRWQPYDPEHRQYMPFEDACLYSGFIRCGDIRRPYLPERVLRQFGYIQTIPRAPSSIVPPYSEIVDAFNMWTEHVLDDAIRGDRVTLPGECEDGYLDWIHKVSHPYILLTSQRVDYHEIEENDRYCQRLLRIGDLARQLSQKGIEELEVTEIQNLCDVPITENVPTLVGHIFVGGSGGRGGRGGSGGRCGRVGKGGSGPNVSGAEGGDGPRVRNRC